MDIMKQINCIVLRDNPEGTHLLVTYKDGSDYTDIIPSKQCLDDVMGLLQVHYLDKQTINKEDKNE